LAITTPTLIRAFVQRTNTPASVTRLFQPGETPSSNQTQSAGNDRKWNTGEQTAECPAKHSLLFDLFSIDTFYRYMANIDSGVGLFDYIHGLYYQEYDGVFSSFVQFVF
jgi:hypothetical protein